MLRRALVYGTALFAGLVALSLLMQGSVASFAIVRALYDTTTMWFPASAVVLAGFALASGQYRHAVLGTLVALGGASVRAYATHYEPTQLEVRRVTITTDKIDRRVRIVHISDVQADAIGAWEASVFETIRTLRPDVLIHTGDLLQPQAPATFASELPKVQALLQRVDAPLGRYTIIGDTDGPLRKVLGRSKVMKLLEDSEHTIDVPGVRLRLIGLDTYTARAPAEARASIEPWYRADPEAFNIAFAHPPDFILAIDDLAIDLNLAGHTHGGQIRLPFIGPPVTLSRVPRHLARGFHQVGKTRLNTSAGIGAEHAHGLPSIRINCPPEVTLITLEPRPRVATSIQVDM